MLHELSYGLDLAKEDFDDEVFQENSVVNFFDDIKPFVVASIKNYFKEKKLYNGKKIHSSLFDLPYYTDVVLKTNVSDGVIKAYKLIEENNFLNLNCESKDIPEDIRYIVNLIKEIQKFVPQEFVGGMLLLHLELIEGLYVW
jgi:hypothetical protein